MATLTYDSVSFMYGGVRLVDKKQRPTIYTIEFKRKLALEARHMGEKETEALSISYGLPRTAIRDFKRDYWGGKL